MAKPSWVKLSKTSGNGDDSFTISADKNTGRNARTGTVSVAGGGITKNISVSQAGATEFIRFTNSKGEAVTSFTVDQAGGSVTVYGYSNVTSLSFSLQDRDGQYKTGSVGAVFVKSDGTSLGGTYNSETAQVITVPTKYTAASSNDITNGSAVPNDPGASNQYLFAYTINFAKANTSVARQSVSVQVLGGNTRGYVSIFQAAGPAILALYSNSTHTTALTKVELTAEGTAKTVYVDSNTDWTIS